MIYQITGGDLFVYNMIIFTFVSIGSFIGELCAKGLIKYLKYRRSKNDYKTI